MTFTSSNDASLVSLAKSQMAMVESGKDQSKIQKISKMSAIPIALLTRAPDLTLSRCCAGEGCRGAERSDNEENKVESFYSFYSETFLAGFLLFTILL